MKEPIRRITIGPLSTKDYTLWERYQRLKENKITLETILKRGIDEIEQDSIDDLKQNNIS